MNGYRFCDRAEGVKLILAILLKKAFGNKAGFIFVNRAIRFSFDSKYPFTTDECVGCGRYKFTGLVL